MFHSFTLLLAGMAIGSYCCLCWIIAFLAQESDSVAKRVIGTILAPIWLPFAIIWELL